MARARGLGYQFARNLETAAEIHALGMRRLLAFLHDGRSPECEKLMPRLARQRVASFVPSPSRATSKHRPLFTATATAAVVLSKRRIEQDHSCPCLAVR